MAVGIFALSDNSQGTQYNNTVIKCIICDFYHEFSVTARIKEKFIPYVTTWTIWKKK